MSRLKWVVWRAEGASEAENVALERREEGGPLIVVGAVFPGRGMYKGKFLVKYAEKVFTMAHATEAEARRWMEAEHARVNEITWSPKTGDGENRYAHVCTEQIGHVFQLASSGKWLGCLERGAGSPDLETEAEAMAWVETEYADDARASAEHEASEVARHKKKLSELSDSVQARWEAERQDALDDGRSGEERLILDWRSCSDQSTWFAFFDSTVPSESGRELGRVMRVSDTRWTAETGSFKDEFHTRLDAQLALESRWSWDWDKSKGPLQLDWHDEDNGDVSVAFVNSESLEAVGRVRRHEGGDGWVPEFMGKSTARCLMKSMAQRSLEALYREYCDVMHCKPPRGDRFYRTKPEPAPDPPPVADCSSERLEDRLIEAVIGVVRTRSTQSIFDLQEEDPMTWQAMRALMRERIHEILEDDLDGRLAALRADECSIPYEQVKENAKWKRVASCAVTVEGVTMELEELQRVPETPLNVRNFEVMVGSFRLNAHDFFAGVENLRVFFDGRRG